MTAVPSQILTAHLRARFATHNSFVWEPEWPLLTEQAGASVLIALRPTQQGLCVLLTRRTEHLAHHPGQICFPGGRVEEADTSPLATALRETEEEIGLRPDQIELLGILPDYSTSSGFRVTPVVGLTAADFTPKLDTFEVAELFEIPLAFLLQSDNYQRHRVQHGNQVRHFYAVPYPGRFIWGATAGMLAMFAAFMRAQEDSRESDSRPTDTTDFRAATATQGGL